MTTHRRSSPACGAPRRTLHIFAVSALVVAQPVFDLLGSNPEFFVAHDLGGVDILALTVFLCVAVPSGLVLLARAVGLIKEEARTWVERIVLAGLFAMLALMFMKQIVTGTGTASLIVAGIVGILAAAVYERVRDVQTFVTWLAVGLVVLPALFLIRPPVARLISPPARPARAVAEPGMTPPLVVIVFDQLPLASLLGTDGLIDASRYPHFAALAGDAIWFRNATTVGHFTEWAVPALLTGRYPAEPRLPSVTDHPNNLFTLLGGAYAFNVHEPLTALCPRDLCVPATGSRWAGLAAAVVDIGIVYLHLALPDSATRTLPPVTQDWKAFTRDDDLQARWLDRRDADRRREPEAFVESLGARERPTLHFLHVLLPHEPYLYLPSGQRAVTSRFLPGLDDDRWTDDELTVAQNYQLHLLQVGYVDRILGRVVERLKDRGLYEETALVVTSDHGVSFRPGGLFKGLSDDNAADLMGVPLLIKLPGASAGTVDARNVETIDVLPTIADMLDLRLPWPVDGRSLLASGAPDRPLKRLYFFDGRHRTFPAVDLDEVVRRRVELLGDGVDLFAPPMAAPFRHLIGTAVSEHVMLEQSDVESSVASVRSFADIDLESDAVPAWITGRVTGGDTERSQALAVSLNGVIRATTQAAPRVSQRPAGFWAALVDPASFHRGDNAIDVYSVSTRGDAVVLRSLYGRDRSETAAHFILDGADAGYGVELSGVDAPEQIGGRFAQCTDGRARLVVPTAGRRQSTAIAVSIARAGVGFSSFELRVDGCLVAEERIPPGRWSRTIPLGGCRLTRDPMTVDIISDVFAMRDGSRTIGVCLDGLRFVK